jgi:hypothetical protein
MATQLNIKDPETVRIVREHAARTGRSVTATVREAVERDRAAQEADWTRRKAELYALVEEVRRNAPPETLRMSSWEIMESIYDDDEPDGFAQ